MPSNEIAELIVKSIQEGEQETDFAFMLDALTSLQRPFHEEKSMEAGEYVAGGILCLLIKPKPAKYAKAMGEFRLLFHGVAKDDKLKALFATSILPAALFLDSLNEIEYQPSLYFSPVPIITFLLRMEGAKVSFGLLSVAERLPLWY